MSLINYTVTRETLDKLAEHGVLSAVEDTAESLLGSYRRACWRHGKREVAELLENCPLTFKPELLNHACLQFVESNGWMATLTKDGAVLQLPGDHGPRWGIPAPLPEALAKALT